MGVILDSSVIIAAERKKPAFAALNMEETVYISSVTVSELLVGANRADTEERRIRKIAFVEYIIGTIAVIGFGIEEARIYAQVLSNLYKENITLGVHDAIIGACAIANGHSVLTMNARDFKRIKGLTVLGMEDMPG